MSPLLDNEVKGRISDIPGTADISNLAGKITALAKAAGEAAPKFQALADELRGRVVDLQHQLDEAQAYIAALPGALRDVGLDELKIVYVVWLAGEGREVSEDDWLDSEDLDPDPLPLFATDSQPDQNSLEQTPESRDGPGFQGQQGAPG